MAFSKWGYSLIMNPTYQPIRDQIEEPDKEILPSFGVVNPESLSHSDGIFIVTEPKELRSLLVTFKLKLDHKIENRAVLLPGPGEDCIKFLEILKELKGKMNLKYTQITLDINLITQRGNVLLPIQLWDDYKREG